MYLKYVFALLSAVAILWVITSCRSAQKCEQSIDTLRVGIVDSDTIMFSVDGKDHLMIYKGEDKIVDEVYENGVLDQRLEMTDFLSKNEPFIIKDVTIGKQFHWEKKEDQVFNGKLQVIAKEGKLHAINIIPVEEYLKSVISSEMSAMNNLELLKAHTIISRSWVLRQVINSTKKMSSEQTLTDSNIENTDSVMRIIKFWDQEDHKYFDVCADDHCQRYQGITRQVSPLVEQAVNETRGEVLKDKDGNVCDARFSKCCGGKSELFSTCWQDTDYDYLQSVDDEFCNTSDSAVLKLVLNDYDQKTIDFHDWTVTYSQSEVSDLFEKKTQLGVGIIQDIIPLKRGASGRISLLRVVGSLKTVEIGKELMIRKAFSESHLYSSAFEVIKEGDSFTLKGCGWGHGVGLCQIGAACMSVKGYDYKQILSHYY
ncbi:MAG: SpoIID/LytB domain-containing protein, partial [Prevotellaceae bacterium]|nr:SpoIID/LytB domain-containing protein [Candidatus Colivivens equi]